MNSPRFRSVLAISVLLLAAVAARGDEPDATPMPTRFRELLHVGDVVLLRMISEHPTFYYIQLLSDGQAEDIQTAYAAYVDVRQRREAIVERLGTERRLNERATLFVQEQTLFAEMQDKPSARQFGPYLYEVAQVAEDFVSFKSPGLEKFVPIHSIRDMYRKDELDAAPRPRSFGSPSPANLPAGGFSIRLRNTRVAEVAAAINLVYPDSKANITADMASNSLLLEGDVASVMQIRSLVDTLDKALPEAAPPINQRER